LADGICNKDTSQKKTEMLPRSQTGLEAKILALASAFALASASSIWPEKNKQNTIYNSESIN